MDVLRRTDDGDGDDDNVDDGEDSVELDKEKRERERERQRKSPAQRCRHDPNGEDNRQGQAGHGRMRRATQTSSVNPSNVQKHETRGTRKEAPLPSQITESHSLTDPRLTTHDSQKSGW